MENLIYQFNKEKIIFIIVSICISIVTIFILFQVIMNFKKSNNKIKIFYFISLSLCFAITILSFFTLNRYVKDSNFLKENDAIECECQFVDYTVKKSGEDEIKEFGSLPQFVILNSKEKIVIRMLDNSFDLVKGEKYRVIYLPNTKLGYVEYIF